MCRKVAYTTPLQSPSRAIKIRKSNLPTGTSHITSRKYGLFWWGFFICNGQYECRFESINRNCHFFVFAENFKYLIPPTKHFVWPGICRLQGAPRCVFAKENVIAGFKLLVYEHSGLTVT